MARLQRTHDALASLEANAGHAYGEHVRRSVQTGYDGVYIGEAEFDPTRHEPSDIDPFAMGEALDRPHVSQVFPSRPLHINIVADRTGRAEDPRVTAIKDAAVVGLVGSIDESLPGVTDQSFIYLAGRGDIANAETLRASSRNELPGQISDLALDGLTIVISDFHGMRFDRSSLDGVVAVKLNHPLERAIPAGVGRISLGGEYELDTRDGAQLGEYNRLLQAHHDSAVAGLESAGAVVASVISDPRYEQGYDIAAADGGIAAAIGEMSSLA
ncbi:MAG TPA: hypothetical protein VFW77_04095 [Candidatus Saccharimonadales bacterium]|nr:hypothetical protein [Candidatus Saccharimonadales bacterium]